MSIFKKKSFYIILLIILLTVAGVAYSKYKKDNKPIEYETVKVNKGDVTRTVDATGKVKSESDLSLRFETAGTVATVTIKEGDIVKEGDVLVSLNLKSLDSSVAQASANLNQQLAGSTAEQLKSLNATVDSAKSALEKAKADGSASVASAESALETAENNLKLAEGGKDSQIVSSEYDNAVVLLQKTASILDDAITQSDNILGIDNTLANDDFEKYLSVQDTSRLNVAKNYYPTARNAKNQAVAVILPLTTLSNNNEVDAVLDITELALAKTNQLLAYVGDMLNATRAVGSLTQTSLDTKKTSISTSRSSITTQYTSVVGQKQDIFNAINSYSTYKIAYEKAIKDLQSTKDSVKSYNNQLQASVAQAEANYKNSLNPAREVDVAYYRAALQQAIVNRNKAILKSPMNGVVTKINRKKGEYISATDIIVEMVSPDYEIEVDVPETDVAKIKINDKVSYTVDALGDSYKFVGKVITIDPQSTEIQDVVYYKVKISISQSDVKSNKANKEIKPGMTANVSIDTAGDNELKNVLYLPLRAILSENGSGRYVRVLKDNKVSNATVKLGSQVDNGFVVIESGVSSGDEIVLSVKQ
ncbi:MAG: HlyD family efflux transporter periplasmic adaptor subunit [bacterium]